MFHDVAKSESVVLAFEKRGVRRADISAVMTHSTCAENFQDARADTQRDAGKVAEGAGAGGAVGGVVGVVGVSLAAIAAMGTVVALPGLNLVVAGPLFASLVGGGAGAAAGGFIGGMLGLGLTKDRAGYYQEGIQRGGILIWVRAKDDADVGRLSTMIREFGGDEIHSS